MNIIRYYKNLKLIISDSLLQEIALLSLQHYPNEFGGLLIGKYSENFKILNIYQSMMPECYQNSPIEFVRQSDNLQSYFNELFNETGLYYVGEWHTHPNGEAFYSHTDLQAMTTIAHFEYVQILNPILLILSITNNKVMDFNFFFLKIIG